MTVSSVDVRMYNVGFGDCFLLKFHYDDGSARHMLVDFGSTSPPKFGSRTNYMKETADDIAETCAGKLDIVVATHRHRDHISGFGGETGKAIAKLDPDVVIQPWTEDPDAPVDAMKASASSYTGGKADPKSLAAHFLGALADMDRVAGAVKKLSADEDLAGRDTLRQLAFLGEDNLKNDAAVRNLMAMGRKGRALYVNAGMKLNDILPGVKITVMGPPNLEQSQAIRKMRAQDPEEFWQFRSFWAAQGHSLTAMTGGKQALFPAQTADPPPSTRWFIRQSRQIHADQMLELVRDLDSVMNNTSVILLLEVGQRKILLPGDAQIENWAYALNQPEWRHLLADVHLYKVGHHGSRNATPKSLWNQFAHRGDDGCRNRLGTLCSTKGGKHGSVRSGTEVPQHLLMDELKQKSALKSTEELRTRYEQITVECA